ncbi:MAG: DUF1266 domain-containing protein [Bacteroidota bacterium]
MNFFSKIFKAFSGLQLDTKNPLSGEQLNHVLVSSMYAEQQSAYLNAYATGINSSDRKKMVHEYWDVYDRENAIKILDDLIFRNHDENLNVVFAAFEQQENYSDILKSGLPDDQDAFNYYLDYFRQLRDIVPELIEGDVIKDFSELNQCKSSGWNLGRGAFLARCVYEMEYITEAELKEYLAKCYSELKQFCTTWKEYTKSYLFGRAMWQGSHDDGMTYIAEDLLTKDKSPLKNKTNI